MRKPIEEILDERILLLDGGFGTMVQGYGLDEAAYRGERFRDWERQLRGCNDLLALTCPDVVREIHEKYLAAGADIIETDSFNANAVSLADYGLEGCAYEIARAAAGVARAAADTFTARNPLKPRFVAGSAPPTARSRCRRTSTIPPRATSRSPRCAPPTASRCGDCWTGAPTCCLSKRSSTRSTPRLRWPPSTTSAAHAASARR